MVYTTKYSKNQPKKAKVQKFNNCGTVRGKNIPASRIYGKEDLKRLDAGRGKEEYDREGMNRLAKQAAEEED